MEGRMRGYGEPVPSRHAQQGAREVIILGAAPRQHILQHARAVSRGAPSHLHDPADRGLWGDGESFRPEHRRRLFRKHLRKDRIRRFAQCAIANSECRGHGQSPEFAADERDRNHLRQASGEEGTQCAGADDSDRKPPAALLTCH